MSNVKLISYTRPSDELIKEGLNDLQDLIAYVARVSNPSNQLNTETTDKLLGYLMKHSHWSPFEMANACLEINTTRDIARQLLRHRSFTFQEYSQRYANPKDLGMFVSPRDARLQDTVNRQNSIPCDDRELQKEWDMQQRRVMSVAKDVYTWALNNDIAKEQARAVLPEGLTKSRLYVNGTIRSWIHYCELRASHGTQLEHSEIAIESTDIISAIFPLIKSIVGK